VDSRQWRCHGEEALQRDLFHRFSGHSHSSELPLHYVHCVLLVLMLLMQYDLKKKSEHALKSIMYNEDEISAIPPTPYRERFVKYVSSIVQ
jgi:hypothetical protein